MEKQEAIDTLVKAGLSVTAAETALDEAVRGARDARVSWAVIGASQGISAQAAWKRWGPKADAAGGVHWIDQNPLY